VAQEQSAPQSSPTPAPDSGSAGSSGGEGAYVTPLVRKLATEHGVDLGSLQGTGVGGRIRKQDVLDAAGQSGGSSQAPAATPESKDTADAGRPQLEKPGEQKSSAPAPAFVDQAVKAAPDTTVRGKTEPMSRLRKVIAERMVESLQISAQLTTVVEVDVTKIARLRAQAKESFEQREGVKLSFMPFFAQATLEALKEHPVVNASVDQDAGTITYHDGVHLGIAVDTERGLLVPVIHGAGRPEPGRPGQEDRRPRGAHPHQQGHARRARWRHVHAHQHRLARRAVRHPDHQPAAGRRARHRRRRQAPGRRADPELGEVVAVRSMVYLALTYDHRIVDGADAARFLVSVKQRLEEGDFAAELGL
jgi:2-oxoglutarate dehydrogenase E2 component (dihydrolipoamide succinyltransferase)